MRSPRAKHNLFAVSANNAETAINTERDADTTLLIDIGDVLNVEPRRESNADELNGLEEPDRIDSRGDLATLPVNFPKAQAQHIAFLLGFGLGSVVTVAAGDGYAHTITPIDGDLDINRSNPSFTGVFRYAQGILKRRAASMFVDSATITFAKDDWVKASGTLKGTGKVTKNVSQETVSALDTATSITLAANAVQGSTAQERLDSIHSILAETSTGVWEEVSFSVVSADTPAVITITAPGSSAASIDYKILYVPEEPTWCTFPAKVVETALRVSEITVNLGGTWNGTAFVGGRELTGEINSVEYQYQGGLEISFVPGAGGDYASRCFRPARVQKVSLNREMRDAIMQNLMDQNETFGFRILAEGALYDATNRYTADIVLPRCGVLNAPISVDGKKLAEAGDILVQEDATYGSAIVTVMNLVSGYAA